MIGHAHTHFAASLMRRGNLNLKYQVCSSSCRKWNGERLTSPLESCLCTGYAPLPLWVSAQQQTQSGGRRLSLVPRKSDGRRWRGGPKLLERDSWTDGGMCTYDVRQWRRGMGFNDIICESWTMASMSQCSTMGGRGVGGFKTLTFCRRHTYLPL